MRRLLLSAGMWMLALWCLWCAILLPVQFFVYEHFRMEVTGDALLAVLAVTSEELSLFWERYVSSWVIAGAVLYLAILGWVVKTLLSLKSRRFSRPAVLAALSLTVSFWVLAGLCGSAIRFHPVDVLREVARCAYTCGRLFWVQRHPALPDRLVRREGPAPVVVVLVGESATRSHWGLYGYPRQTTPCLAAEADNLVRFDAVQTAWPSTQMSILYAYTGLTRDHQGEMTCTLVQACRRAGFQTALVSAQARKGAFDSIVSHVFAGCDETIYLEELSPGRKIYDEQLLPPLERILASADAAPLLCLVHMMGSHVDAVNRYPRARACFRPDEGAIGANRYRKVLSEDLVNAYDNSIAYTDFVAGKILERLKGLSRPSLLVYLSDHGESVGSSSWRVATDPDVWKVPMVVWFSPAYRAAYPDLVESCVQRAPMPQCSDRLFGFFLKLFGVVTEGDMENGV